MAKSDLWQKLNSEVSIASMKALLTGQPLKSTTDPATMHAEELMEYASREAKRRGKRVETVLAELGFDMGPVAPAATPVPQAPPVVVVVASTPAPAAQPIPTPGSARDSAIRAVTSYLAPLSEADVAALLDSDPAAGVSGYLERLGCLFPEHQAATRIAANAAVPWLALFLAGIPAQDLAQVARTAPSCPLMPTDLPPATGLGRRPSKAAMAGFPAEWIRALHVLPLRRSGAALVVAVPYVPPERLTQQLEARLGRRVQWHLASLAEIAAARAVALDEPVQLPAPVTPAPSALSPVRPAPLPPPPSVPSPTPTPTPAPRPSQLPLVAPPPLSARRAPTPVPVQLSAPGPAVTAGNRPHAVLPELPYTSAVEMVQRLLNLALEARATDIHIEPAESGCRIRFRIDGICHEVMRLGPEPYGEIAARLKILADLDVTERRRPQDGHMQIAVNGVEHDLRVSTIPARGGEKVGLRIANTGRVAMRLEQLGLAPQDLAVLRDVASLPFGMILATGPVGSGKTTTLYSCLNEVDRSERHVMSIEDPIEFTLEGANHVEVNYAIGFDFVQGLRALLRQDPDTILIGEIRDEETARIAVRASMTGLMVYSTLHANEATGAVTTLRNYHIPSHLLASAIRGVVAQRLLRKICARCKVPQAIGEEDLRSLGVESLPEGFAAFRGQGCAACLHTGYSGRTGVFEIFRVDETVRNLIQEDRSERDIRAYAIAQGMHTLQQDGLRKIADGTTTIEEYHRILRF